MSEKTKEIKLANQDEAEVKKIILTVFNALKEKGYNPISQIVGYILSDDPTYITTHNNARNLIRRIDRFELLQILLRDYIASGDTGR
ncbi:MAG: IreB family regulatory phosphoprotein [Oscillospiraceae bacterium]|nr:IreB family regulatory phosphoprotein [Oscillospiraceae bacterium]